MTTVGREVHVIYVVSHHIQIHSKIKIFLNPKKIKIYTSKTFLKNEEKENEDKIRYSVLNPY